MSKGAQKGDLVLDICSTGVLGFAISDPVHDLDRELDVRLAMDGKIHSRKRPPNNIERWEGEGSMVGWLLSIEALRPDSFVRVDLLSQGPWQNVICLFDDLDTKLVAKRDFHQPRHSPNQAHSIQGKSLAKEREGK